MHFLIVVCTLAPNPDQRRQEKARYWQIAHDLGHAVDDVTHALPVEVLSALDTYSLFLGLHVLGAGQAWNVKLCCLARNKPSSSPPATL
jgi:hypothetical protein